jgi:hypothetical protein
MTYDEFDNIYDNSYDLQDQHMVYIMENSGGERAICNGDDMIIAQEEGYLYEDFRDHYIEKYMLVEA